MCLNLFLQEKLEFKSHLRFEKLIFIIYPLKYRSMVLYYHYQT